MFLAGQATKSTGPVRVFQTSRLADGQRWERYTIRAEVNRDGTTVSQERTIKLQGGRVADVTIDFPSTQLASANGTR